MSAKCKIPVSRLAPWFGSKSRLAPTIVEELGEHRGYMELCAGSMAVLLRKPKCGLEVVNDLHGDLINLARVVASDRWEELCERCSRTLYCDGVFHDARELCKEPGPVAESVFEIQDEHIQRAHWWFVAEWQGRNGTSGTRDYNNSPGLRTNPTGGSGTSRYQSAIASIQPWHERLKSVQIIRRDAFEFIARWHDEPGIAVYVDPPYVEKGSSYLHDFKREDHERLAAALRRFKSARIVVSYYDHPLIRDLYRGWRVVDCSISKGMYNQGGRTGTVKAPEILLINDTPEASEPLSVETGAGLFGGTP